MIGRLFIMEAKRAFFNRRFVGCIILMVLVEAFSSSLIFSNMSFGVDEILDNLFSGTGSATVLLMLFPLFPYASSYAKDMEGGVLEYYVVRAGAVRFFAVRFVMAILSAVACVVMSFALFACLLLCMGHPLSVGTTINTSGNTVAELSGYQEFLGSHIMAWFFCYAVDRGLSAGMMAACAMFLSVLYPNSFFVLLGPVCLYFLSLRIIFPGETEALWLLPDSWIEGVYESSAGGLVTLLCKMGVAGLIFLFYGVISMVLAERRWHNA